MGQHSSDSSDTGSPPRLKGRAMIHTGGRLENVSPTYAQATRDLLPSPERRCACGDRLSQYNRSDTCHRCQARQSNA